MKQILTRAIVLIEDHRFYQHFGIDPVAILRAVVVNLTEKRRAQGGSTITQQLARTLFLHNKKTYIRKLKEIMLAFYLEIKYSKKDILKMYMDNVYMGHDTCGCPIRGFDKAADFYFQKALHELSVSEQAALVAMLKGPNIYKPSSNYGTARRVLVLGKLLDKHLIDEDTFFEASRTRL